MNLVGRVHRSFSNYLPGGRSKKAFNLAKFKDVWSDALECPEQEDGVEIDDLPSLKVHGRSDRAGSDEESRGLIVEENPEIIEGYAWLPVNVDSR